MTEAGITDYAVDPWFGVYGPAGMPADIVQTLSRAYNEALEMPEVKEKLLQAGFSPRGSSARELADLSRVEYERLGKVARDANMTAE
jgi:tripartite-type tricarboxylate transporter receptor subunit TctC